MARENTGVRQVRPKRINRNAHRPATPTRHMTKAHGVVTPARSIAERGQGALISNQTNVWGHHFEGGEGGEGTERLGVGRESLACRLSARFSSLASERAWPQQAEQRRAVTVDVILTVAGLGQCENRLGGDAGHCEVMNNNAT